jgi:hypothetical protein
LLQGFDVGQVVQFAEHIERGEDLAALGVELAVRRIADGNILPIAWAARWFDL